MNSPLSVQVHFKNIQQKIIERLDAANDSIYVAVAWITDSTIINILIRKASEGIDVKVLCTNSEYNRNVSHLYKELIAAGAEVAIIGKDEAYTDTMHHKFCVIDKLFVINGSYNWSKNAQTNTENITITEGVDIALDFLAEFNNVISRHNRANENPSSSILGSIWEGIKEILNLNKPTISSFSHYPNRLTANNPITFKWKLGGEFSEVYLNGKNVTYKSEYLLKESDKNKFVLKVVNRNIPYEITSEALHIEIDNTLPIIKSFTSSADFVSNGESITLNWQVANATRVELVNIGQQRADSLQITPNRDTTYCLRAYGCNKEFVEKRLKIKIDKTPPKIRYFRADRLFLQDASPLTLSWNVENAAHVSVSMLGEIENHDDTAQVFPKEDTVFKIKATNYYGVSSETEFEVLVSKQPPIIHSFVSDLSLLTDDTPAKLSWSVENAEEIYLDDEFIDITENEFSVHHMEDCSYSLTAVSYFGVETKATVHIPVDKMPPQISYLKSDKEYILSDYSVTLFWETVNPVRVEILGIGDVDAIGSLKTVVKSDTTFILHAYNYFGYKSEQTLSIHIVPVPLIEKLLIPDINVELTTSMIINQSTPDIKSVGIQLKTANLISLNTDLLQENQSTTEQPKAKSSITDYVNNLRRDSKKLFNNLNRTNS